MGIVTAYSDMLSAHAVYYRFPEEMKVWAREVGATAQVAGGVPAICDGVTQRYAGMELSLFSREAIALATVIALSHGTFEAAALLGICDKIVPGLLIGALRFGHLPMILVSPVARCLRDCPTRPRRRSASGMRPANAGARSCCKRRSAPTTAKVPAPSMAPPTPIR